MNSEFWAISKRAWRAEDTWYTWVLITDLSVSMISEKSLRELGEDQSREK